MLVHAPEALTERLATAGHAALEAAFGTRVATYRTEPSANTFPALPVRDDHVVASRSQHPAPDPVIHS